MSGIPAIGDVVREWRRYRQISLTEFSKRTKRSKGYISELEHNKIDNPKPDKLKRMATALGISVMDIVSRRLPDEVKDGNVASNEDRQGVTLSEVAEGETPGGMQPALGQPRQKASSPSTRLNAPVSTSYKEILEQRLAVLEKILRNAHEELREIGALVARMQEE
jgi:transcriptional regulator with XRE-family HTH domain